MFWDSFLKRAVVTFMVVVGVLYSFVLCFNPYGNLSTSPFRRHVIMDDNQRFQYPAVIRSGDYDSIVIGTSTARHLNPDSLNRHLGGRFANLAMNSAMAWEQYRVADLFLREVSAPRTLLVGLDHVWCWENADTQRITKRGFPEWMYDDSPWNDFLYMLNSKAVEIAIRQVSFYLGINPERLGANGFRVFTPPDETYDVEKARRKMFRLQRKPVVPPFVPTTDDLSSWRYPALAWLDEIVGRTAARGKVLLVFTPPHVAYLEDPGSLEEARFEECKRRISGIASRHGAHLVDFRIPSPITRADDNFWDSGHYRVHIGERVIRDTARALETGRDDPMGNWRYLAGPANQR